MASYNMLCAITLVLAAFALPATGQTYLSALEALKGEKLAALESVATLVGLGSTLTVDANATLFAPTDEAFTAVIQSTGLDLSQLTPDVVEILRGVIAYHLVPVGAVLSSQLTDGQTLPTALPSETLKVDLSSPPTVTIIAAGSTATVVKADIKAGSLVIHVVDHVLLPSYLAPLRPAPPPVYGAPPNYGG